MPTPTPTPPAHPLDTAAAESADALAAMESEAAEFFAARDAARTAEALNPVAPALERAAEAAAAPAPPSRSKEAASPLIGKAPPTAAAPSAKVPGAPILKAAKEAEAAAKDAAAPKDAKADASKEFSDIPRKYEPGKMRGANWDKLHAKADHFESLATAAATERDALRAEVESLRAASVNGAPSADLQQRLTTLQTERDSLQARLEAVAVERSPRFEAQFKPRQQAEILAAKDAVGPELAKTVEELLNTPKSAFRDAKLAEIADGLSVLQRDELLAAARALHRIDLERQQLASQGSELWKQWVAEENTQRERAAAERTQRAASAFDAELREWEVAGVTAEEAATARSVYSGQGATLQDAARASLWAVKGPQLAQMAQDLTVRVAELEGELSKLRGAQPGVGAAASGALPSPSAEDDDPTTTGYVERIAREAMRGGVRFGV